MTGEIVSINRSNGGVPKREVEEALVTLHGIAGDRQRDLRHHGGPDRALSLYSLDLLDQLRLEGHDVGPGVLGENVTIRGLDWRAMLPGVRLMLGRVEIELTGFAAPCKTIRHAFLDEEFKRISDKLHPGWSRVYARVVAGGVLRRGDEVTLVSASNPALRLG